MSVFHDVITAFLHPGGPYLFIKLVTAGYVVSAIGRLIPVRHKQVPGYRPRPGRAARQAAGILAAAAALTGCGYLLSAGGKPAAARPSATRAAAVAGRPGLPAAGAGLRLGVFEPGEGSSYRPVERFAAAVGRQPDIVLTYSAWLEPFETEFARTLHDHGAEPLIQIEPGGASLTAITGGRFDAYLRSYATEVREFGHPVILSFAPEPNGSWYPWGWTRSSPAAWVAAWRHVVTVFRQQEARNVTWLWTVNIGYQGSAPLRDYWPGAAYVSWAGVDGYYIHRTDTFARVFGPTITSIRRLTRKPVLIAETAAGQVAGQARIIPGLFAGIRRHHLLGLVWFDQAQHHGTYHQDWRLEGHRAAIAAFRSQLARSSRVTSGPPCEAPGLGC
jgi:mannan endo-1,4-beta-mannosidase